MSAKNTGGPAFPTAPQQVWDGDRDIQIGERPGASGMTLRDYFAAKAMQGLIYQATRKPNTEDELLWLGERSYQIADQMLKAREA